MEKMENRKKERIVKNLISLLNLPDELILLIFHYVFIYSLIQLRRVSKKVYRISNDFTLWKEQKCPHCGIVSYAERFTGISNYFELDNNKLHEIFGPHSSKIEYTRSNATNSILELPFTNLTELDLYQTEIGDTLGPDILSDTLIKCDLSECGLEIIKKSTFPSSLKWLNLAFNRLKEIEYGAFENCEILDYLNLSFNPEFIKLLKYKESRNYKKSSVNLFPKKVKHLRLRSNTVQCFDSAKLPSEVEILFIHGQIKDSPEIVNQFNTVLMI